jgi:hypothetical protein
MGIQCATNIDWSGKMATLPSLVDSKNGNLEGGVSIFSVEPPIEASARRKWKKKMQIHSGTVETYCTS